MKPTRMKTATAHTFTWLSLAGILLTSPVTAKAAPGGGGGGNNKPGKNEPGQIVPVQLFLDDIHPLADSLGNAVPNGLVSDGLRNDPEDPGDTTSYVDGEDGGLFDVGENFNIPLDPNNSGNNSPARSYVFPLGITDPLDAICSDLFNTVCEPDLGTTKIKGQTVPLLVECVDPTLVPVLPGSGRAPDADLTIHGANHDDSPVGCVRHVNATLRLTDAVGEEWNIIFGAHPGGGGKLYSPCGSCVVVERAQAGDNAVWTFHTEPPHFGYLYNDGKLHSVVSLPFSGTIISLSPEPEPTALTCDDFSDSGDCPNSNP